jgi:hypothetical protein
MQYSGVLLNQLRGSIPSFVAQWSDIKQFEMTGSHLTGTIPEDIGNLVDLVRFAVHINSLKGTLPSSIGSNWSQIVNASFFDYDGRSSSAVWNRRGIANAMDALCSLQQV